MELTISLISFLTTVDSSGVMLCCVFQAFKALQRPLQKEREKWSWKELVLELEGVAFAPKADLSWSYAAAFEMGDLHGYDGYELRVVSHESLQTSLEQPTIRSSNNYAAMPKGIPSGKLT